MTAQLEKANFLLSSRPQTGIRSPPILGPRPSSRALSPRVSFIGLRRAYPARTVSGSRAAAEHSDPELRSFRWILRDGQTYKIEVSLFLVASLLEKQCFIVPPLFFPLLLQSSFDISLRCLGLAVYRFL